jgi:membrane protein DedA with SNARE-associated domain
MLLAGIGDWIRDAVTAGGYPVLALLILAENVFPPIPSELILPLAGFYVGRGELAFGWTVAAASLGSVTGALILYGLARHGGRPLLLRHGRLLRLHERDLDRADAFFDRHGSWFVLLGRLVPGVRSLVSVPAGLSEMPLLRFVLLTLAGSTAWNATLVGAGWLLGSNYGRVADVIGPISTGVAVALGFAVAGFVVWWYRRRRASSEPTR